MWDSKRLQLHLSRYFSQETSRRAIRESNHLGEKQSLPGSLELLDIFLCRAWEGIHLRSFLVCLFHMFSSTLLSRLVDMGSRCSTIAILHPVPGACLMNSLTCLERSHKTDLLWAKANASPKTKKHNGWAKPQVWHFQFQKLWIHPVLIHNKVQPCSLER